MTASSPNVVWLCLTALLERFSYYGMRALIVLYAIDAAGLQLDRTEAIGYYGMFTSMVYLLPLPMGILTDLVLKQKNAVIIGGAVSLIGYSMLMINELYIVAVGLVIIAVGSALVKPNLGVLIGREFDKRDSKRVVGFVGLYTAINIGAFLSALAVGYFGEAYGWAYGFGLAGAATLIYLILFVATKKDLKEVEKNLSDTNVYKQSSLEDQEDILDDTFENTGHPNHQLLSKRFDPVPLLIITMLAVSLYWVLFQLGYERFIMGISSRESLLLFGTSIDLMWFNSFSTIVGILLGILLIIYWSIKKAIPTLLLFSIALLLMSFGLFLFNGIEQLSDDNLILYAIIPLIAITIAEFLITPIALSYITRLADVRFSSTIYGGYLLVSLVFIKAVTLPEFIMNGKYFMLVLAAIGLIAGLALLIYRKPLESMAGGIE